MKHRTQLSPQHPKNTAQTPRYSTRILRHTHTHKKNSWSKACGKTGTEVPRRSLEIQIFNPWATRHTHRRVTQGLDTDGWASATCSTRVQGLTVTIIYDLFNWFYVRVLRWNILWFRRDHVTPLLKELHWQPVKFRCHYKIATLAFRHYRQPSFSVMVPSLWNSLPATLRNVPTLSQFKPSCLPRLSSKI